jgi:pyridoxal phosphate enzyme (YggS family)
MSAVAAVEGGLEARIERVRTRTVAACDRVGRDPAEVTLIAVTKTRPAAVVAAACEAGIRDFGENYSQEALAKMQALAGGWPRLAPGQPDSPRFHMIGHLQTNKARACAGVFATLQGVDSEKLLLALARASNGREPLRVMLQVNIGEEPAKHGVPARELGDLLTRARAVPGISVLGLMAIPPPAASPEDSRPYFRRMRELAEQHGLKALSMGMTDDFEVAIEEGATHIRVGRAIFGGRPA